MPRGGSR